MKLARRTLLQASTLFATAASLPLSATVARAKTKKFTYGVASGDPLQDRVILWTKVELTQAQESVRWQIATDRRFKALVQEGVRETDGARDGIVKFDCLGLKAGTTYYYRFFSGKQQSTIGRTKTLPVGDTKKLRLAICSCANYNSGFFAAYRGIAETKDLDAVLHLGDYIYEYGNNVYGKLRSVRPVGECLTLSDYRARYAHYRSDGDLQKFHASHPVIAVWDDHEMANNGWRDGAQNHSPATEGDWSERQKAARQAYFEWLPIRPYQNKIYRSFIFGNLASLLMIDTRYDGRDKELTLAQFLRKDAKGKPTFDKQAFEEARGEKGRKIMSRAQNLWLKNALNKAARTTRWSLIGNQVPFQAVYISPLKLNKEMPKIVQQVVGLAALARKAGVKKVPLSLDEWSGFPAAQERLVRDIKKAGNPTLVLTGDTHNGWATFYGNKTGIELGTPGISSPGTEAYIPKSLWGDLRKSYAKTNPSSFFRDIGNRGFMILEVTPTKAKANWIWADAKKRRGRLSKGPTLTMPRDDLTKSTTRT